MKFRFIILTLILNSILFSCTSIIEPDNCKKLDKIEVFSIGFSDLTFPIRQSEADVRQNPQGIITDSVSLRRIDSLIKELEICKEDDRKLGSIMGVADFYCENGEKYTLIYDRFLTKINNSFYCKDIELLNELFGRK